MKILSIDPGVTCLGWAWWVSVGDSFRLYTCGLSQHESSPRLATVCASHARTVWAGAPAGGDEVCVFVEEMRVGGERDRGPEALAKANDLLRLQAIGAYLAGRFGEYRPIPVLEWKGTATKQITKARAEKTLNAHELLQVQGALSRVRASLHHNLWDAVGIGLHATRRYRIRP